MAKEIRPWYRWHWHNYRTSKHVLDFCLSTNPAQAHGCYRLLLDAMWERGCELPKNREILWTLAGCKTREQYEEVADAVESCFDETEDKQRFTSELLSTEWHSATALLEKKREAGKVGGKASAEARAQAPVKQDSTSAQASSSSSNSIKGKPTRDDSNQQPAEETEAFNGIEVAQKFLDEFGLNGTTLRRAVEEAVTQRAGLREIIPAEAMDEICGDYQDYLDTKPEFKKAPKNWLAECNQSVSKKPAQMKWKEIVEPIYTPAPVVNDPRRRPR